MTLYIVVNKINGMNKKPGVFNDVTDSEEKEDFEDPPS